MKNLLLVCLLALASLAGADQSINRAGVAIDVAPAGCIGTITMTAATYALNNVTPGVQSSIQDLSSVPGGIMFNITGATNTVGQAIVVFEFSHVTYAAFVEGYRAIGAGSRCIPRNNRYMRLRNASSPVALSVTAAYWVAADTGASSSSASGAGSATPVTLTVITGQAATSYFDKLTSATAAGTNIIGAVGVTSTTYASWTQLKSVTVTVSVPTILNLTTVAGTSGIMKYQIGSSNSNSAGFYWAPRADATWFNPRNFYSTTTTAFIDDYLTAGQHIVLSPASATDISNTVEVNLWKLTQVVP